MEIPKVLACSVNECAFNSNKECHALAINVGGHHPACDTFTNHGHNAGGTENMGIGAARWTTANSTSPSCAALRG